MKKIIQILFTISIAALYGGCDKNSDTIVNPPVAGLSASATSVTLLSDAGAVVIISDGTEPYLIAEQANSTIAEAKIDARQVIIIGKSLGATMIKVKDSSTPAKTVTVTVNVVSAYTTNIAGSLSFNSNRGNFSANGIASLGNVAPVSGSGVIALSDFSGMIVYAYNVNSTTSIDVISLFFQSTTTLSVGTYSYPSLGYVVQIVYLPNINPADTVSLDRGYILATSATAKVDTLTSSIIKGTFSGTGYFVDNGTATTTQTISIANGVFAVPILRIGKKQENVIEKIIIRSVKKLK